MKPILKRRDMIDITEGDYAVLDRRLARTTSQKPLLPYFGEKTEGQQLFTPRNAFEYRLMISAEEHGGISTSEAVRLTSNVSKFSMHPLIYPDNLPDLGMGIVVLEERYEFGRKAKVSSDIVVGRFAILHELMLKRFAQIKSDTEKEHEEVDCSILRTVSINVSQAAKTVRGNGSAFQAPGFTQDDHDLIFMLRAKYQFPDWVPQNLQDWDTVHLIDPR